MPFEKLEIIVPAGRKGMPASVVLMGRKNAREQGRPACIVFFSAAFAERAKIARGDTFDVALGSGDHEGLLQLERAKDGAVTARKSGAGGIKLYCGYIERFGTEPEEKQYCSAEAIGDDTILVVLPAWATEPQE